MKMGYDDPQQSPHSIYQLSALWYRIATIRCCRLHSGPASHHAWSISQPIFSLTTTDSHIRICLPCPSAAHLSNTPARSRLSTILRTPFTALDATLTDSLTQSLTLSPSHRTASYPILHLPTTHPLPASFSLSLCPPAGRARSAATSPSVSSSLRSSNVRGVGSCSSWLALCGLACCVLCECDAVVERSSRCSAGRCVSEQHSSSTAAPCSHLTSAPVGSIYGSPLSAVGGVTPAGTLQYGVAIAINTSGLSACESVSVEIGEYAPDPTGELSLDYHTVSYTVYSTQAPNGSFLYLPFSGVDPTVGAAQNYGLQIELVAGFTNSDLLVYTVPGAGASLGESYPYDPNNNALPEVFPTPSNFLTPLAVYLITCPFTPTQLTPPATCASSSSSSAATVPSSSSSTGGHCSQLIPPQLPSTITTTSTSTSSTSLIAAPTDAVYGSQAFSVSSVMVVCGLGLAINTALMSVCDVAQLRLAIYQTDQGTHVTQVAATANVNVYSTQAPNGQYLYLPFVGGSVQLNTSATYLLVAGFTAGSALQVYANTSQSAGASGKFAYSPSTPLTVSAASFSFHATVSQSLVFAPVQGASCDCFTASTLQPISPLCVSSSSSSSTAGCRLRGASGHC